MRISDWSSDVCSSDLSYSDYQCPFCRKIHPALERLAQEDGRVRIVYRDWPIFGPASEEAARMAIASQWQNKHRQFNDALMRTEGKLSSEKIRSEQHTSELQSLMRPASDVLFLHKKTTTQIQ